METAFKEGLILGRCFAMSTLRLLGHISRHPAPSPVLVATKAVTRAACCSASNTGRLTSAPSSKPGCRHTPPGHASTTLTVTHPMEHCSQKCAATHLQNTFPKAGEGAGGTFSVLGQKESSNQ